MYPRFGGLQRSDHDPRHCSRRPRPSSIRHLATETAQHAPFILLRDAVVHVPRDVLVSGGDVPARPAPVPLRFDLSVARPADWRAFAVIGVAAASTDLAIRSGIAVL